MPLVFLVYRLSGTLVVLASLRLENGFIQVCIQLQWQDGFRGEEYGNLQAQHQITRSTKKIFSAGVHLGFAFTRILYTPRISPNFLQPLRVYPATATGETGNLRSEIGTWALED